MQKEIVIVIIIIILIIGTHSISQSYTQKSVSLMTEKLNEIEEIAKKLDEDDKQNIDSPEKKEELSQKISDIRTEWQKINKNMAVYIEHDELEKVNTSLILMDGYLSMEDYSQGVPELENCEYILRHIKDKQSLQIINLF